jgi:hypothetical protein
VLDYFEIGGNANIQLQWQVSTSSSVVTIPQANLSTSIAVDLPDDGICSAGAAPAGGITPLALVCQVSNGLNAKAHRNATLSDLSPYDTTVTNVDFNWGLSAPSQPFANQGIPADNFSIRFYGSINFPTAGTYTLYTDSDDGAILWLYTLSGWGAVISDFYTYATVRSYTITISSPGWYPIALDYSEYAGGAYIKLGWAGPNIPAPPQGQAYTIIPTSNLSTSFPVAQPPYPFAVRISNELGTSSSNWNATEISQIQEAARIIGEAFDITMPNSNVVTSQEAFYRVMANGETWPYVYFYKADGTSANVTIKYPPGTLADAPVTVDIGGCRTFNSIPRVVVCNWSSTQRSPFPVHALVHELGHVFTNRSQYSSANNVGFDERTRGLLYSAIQNTQTGACSPSFAPTNYPNLFPSNRSFADNSCFYIVDQRGLNGNGVVMGSTISSGWIRGENGWGSGPDNIFTPFQMHPPDFSAFINDTLVTKIDETAADMFLNWVYRRRTNNPPTYKVNVPGTWDGFRNSAWPNNSANAQNDANYPGDARFEWMNIIMGQIFTLKGW